MISRKQKKNKEELVSQKYQILIDIANKCENIMERIPETFSQFQFNDLIFDIQCCKSSKLANEDLEEVLKIVEINMKTMYEQSSWGWNSSIKRKEITHKNAHIILVRNKISNEIVAFVHFRFEFDDDHYKGIIYCYELQIKKVFQRIGIGKYLMEILNFIGKGFKINKLVLTCFNHNTNAMTFYIDKLGFHIDKSSPSRCVKEKTFFEILSLKIF